MYIHTIYLLKNLHFHSNDTAIDENGKCVKTRRFIGEDVLLPMYMAAKKCEVPFFVDTDFKGVKEVYFEVIAYNCFGKASAKLISNKVNLAKS